MKRISCGLSLAALGLSLMACGTNKFYTLPADPQRISETQTYIAACASERGLEAQKADNIQSVRVAYDDTSTIYYQYNEGDHLNMQVNVDQDKVPAGEMQRKLSAVKARGDEIYACAQARLAPPQDGYAQQQQHMGHSDMSVSMNVNANVNANGSASSSIDTRSTNLHGSCARAVECYSQLAKTVCTQGAQKCSFKVEVSGNDEEGCRQALLQVPDLLQPFQMMQPGLSAPAVCRAQ